MACNIEKFCSKYILKCSIFSIINSELVIYRMVNVWTRGCGTYGRNGKFRPTFKSGTEKHLFSIPLLMTWCPKNAPNCTDLHLYFQKKFSGGNTPRTPQHWEGLSPFPTLVPLHERPPSHFFRASAAAGPDHRTFIPMNLIICMMLFAFSIFYLWSQVLWCFTPSFFHFTCMYLLFFCMGKHPLCHACRQPYLT